jgi:hypothetical protein
VPPTSAPARRIPPSGLLVPASPRILSRRKIRRFSRCPPPWISGDSTRLYSVPCCHLPPDETRRSLPLLGAAVNIKPS